jgi:hypothetical protein
VAWAALTQVQRYRRFLELLSLQYADSSREYAVCRRAFFLDDPADAWTLEDQKRGDELGHLLELQIESFYVFAKILLDKIALSVERHFGSARGLSLGSHDKLVKNLDRYAASQRFGVQDALRQQARTLKLRVSDFRDKSIEHVTSPHVSHGVGLDEDGRITLTKLRKPAAAADWQVAESSEITQLLPLLDSYILAVLSLLRLLPATVTSLSPLKVTTDGARTPAPALKDPNHVYSVNDRVLLRLHTPYVPFIVGLLEQKPD